MQIASLGPAKYLSPLVSTDASRLEPTFVEDDERILVDDVISPHNPVPLTERDTLELAGPRRTIYFDPWRTTVGIVTCGGLCPGLNDVIRGLTMVAWHRYGVRRILGFRYGFRGCAPNGESWEMTPERIADIHESGGSILGSSRGPQDPRQMLQRLRELGVNILFVIGGDGTMKGALAIAQAARDIQYPLAIVGVPKTVDNDIGMIDRSFGFSTAYGAAVSAIRAAHHEARGYPNGVGLVKLMGRHSGYIACHAALASSHVNFALIPEVPFELEGEGGFLKALLERLERRRHAVVVVAEGAGQQLLQEHSSNTDASGNVKLGDIGHFLTDRIKAYFEEMNVELSLKYIDPSYMIRSVPANADDGIYCWRLAEDAVHAAMAGKTEMLVARWHRRFVHVPIAAAVARRNQIDPNGTLWQSVLESTGQGSLVNSCPLPRDR